MSTANIMRGLRWQNRVTLSGSDTALVPEGVEIRSQVRQNEHAVTAIATLTTENGGIERVSDDAFDIVLTADQTEACEVGRVVMDFWRMDTEYPANYGFKLSVKVEQGPTRAT